GPRHLGRARQSTLQRPHCARRQGKHRQPLAVECDRRRDAVSSPAHGDARDWLVAWPHPESGPRWSIPGAECPPRFGAPLSHYLRPIGLVSHLSSARGRDMVAETTELSTGIGQGSGVNPWLIAITRSLRLRLAFGVCS